MGKITKILLFLFALAGLGFSVCVLSVFYPTPYVYDYVSHIHQIIQWLINSYPWLSYVFAGFAAVLCLCFLGLMAFTLFCPGKQAVLTVSTKKGRLFISKNALVSTVRYSVSDVRQIESAKIKVKIGRKPEKTAVYVKLSLGEYEDLVPFTQAVQKRISDALEKSLSVSVKNVTVRLTEINAKTDDSAPKKRLEGKAESRGEVLESESAEPVSTDSESTEAESTDSESAEAESVAGTVA